MMDNIVSLLDPTRIQSIKGVGESGSSPDTGEWENIGVPVGNLWNANENYFYYHHTHSQSQWKML
jgi:carboxypeptidase Q